MNADVLIIQISSRQRLAFARAQVATIHHRISH